MFAPPDTVEPYVPRRIAFREVRRVGDWAVKLYTITNRPAFSAEATVEAVGWALPHWLERAEASPLPVYRVAFLIVHEAREGLWILLCWWAGGEMVETVVHFASHDVPAHLKPSPHEGSLVCVWELEVMLHERRAWIEHVLRPAPDLPAYLNDVLNP
ncbi:MAG: hypothetical protein AAGI71_03855 [Bacteroidota bacterium]